MSAITITHFSMQPNSRYARIRGAVQGKPLRIGQRLTHPVYNTQLTVCNVYQDNQQSLEYLVKLSGELLDLQNETCRTYN